MAATACPLMRPRCERNPNKATALMPIQRPDTYQRLPRTCTFSIANSSRFIHSGSKRSFAAPCLNVRFLEDFFLIRTRSDQRRSFETRLPMLMEGLFAVGGVEQLPLVARNEEWSHSESATSHNPIDGEC